MARSQKNAEIEAEMDTKEFVKKVPMSEWQAMRTPEVFEEQIKWNLEEDPLQPHRLEKNYPSAEEHKDHLRSHLEAEVSEGSSTRCPGQTLRRSLGRTGR